MRVNIILNTRYITDSRASREICKNETRASIKKSLNNNKEKRTKYR